MKKVLFALLLLAGAAAMMATWAFAASPDERLPMQLSNSKLLRQVAHGHALGTSAAIYDTTWVGYSATNHLGPQNYWNIYTGVRRPNVGDPNDAEWTFEDFTNVHGDSLMGWWPTFDRPGAIGVDDHAWTWSCVDAGNTVNMKLRGTNSARTYGVPGVWHADPGVGAGRLVFWTPMSGTKSAWCGLRGDDDNSVVDATTGNAFNGTAEAIYGLQGAGATRRFPGFGRQWDQMLYRDITPVTGDSLTLSFLYRVWLSQTYTDPGHFPAIAAGRRGWFHGDPLSTNTGNFISAFNYALVDSFQVYIGVPVNDAAVTLSNGSVAPVYDPQRRWFSEVLRIFDGPSAPYYELGSFAGISEGDTTSFSTFSRTIQWSTLNTIVSSPLNATGKIRLVFRVKTNNTGDDMTGNFTTEQGGRGAAMVDDVKAVWNTASAVTLGDFEGAEGTAGNINNAVGADPAVYWRSTGKPPAMYFHARPLAGLAWHDLCGAVGAGTRTCDMQGNVLDAGNDPDETLGDPSFEAGKQNYPGILSPAIDLTTTVSPNPMGITSAKVAGNDDYYVAWDIYTGDFNYSNTGALYYYGLTSWPQVSARGVKMWSDVITSPSVYYSPDPLCYHDLFPLKSKAMLSTSNASGIPDSIRLWVGIQNWPLAYSPAALGTNPTDGAYYDNLALAIVNKSGGTGDVGTISSDIWQWFNDAFPVGGPALGTGTTVAALDTCGALIKGALNNAQSSTNAGLGGNRLDILADSIMVQAGDLAVAVGDTNSAHIRVDMVFRILPGPGNYRSQAGVDTLPKYPLKTGMHLLRRPDDRVTIVDPTNGSDHSFWAEYIRNPGQFSGGNHNGNTSWDNLTWNSARCDTLETDLFPTGNISTTFPVSNGLWQSTIHESDPKYALLGISRPRCFIIDTTTVTIANSTNIICGAAPAWLTTVPQSRTGWDGTVTTTEGTKIIPDGLLTPGSHVQYFFRKSQIFQHNGYAMDPDTTTIYPQPTETSFDGHRWQEFSILPDRWKDTKFGGDGMACMLYADYNDRRGDELVWVSVMDSIGGTRSTKWGSHNGWHAGPMVSLDATANPNLQAQTFVYKNAQPGTLWDMYAVRATESNSSVGTRLGGRLGILGADRLLGHDAKVAPTPDMLKQFYTTIALLTGDLNSNDLGPASECPEDDIAILSDYLTSGTGLVSKPRGLFVAGHGFAESEAVDPTHASFLATQLGLSLVNGSYAALASNTRGCTDLTSTAVISSTDIYGVGLSCFYTDDVIQFNPAKPGAQNVSFYENTGAGPYAAAVYHAKNSANDPENFVSLVDAFDIANLWGRYCATSYGRLAMTYKTMTSVYSQVCSGWINPGPPLDVPQGGHGGVFANYMKVGNSVMRSGNANVHFGVAATGRVRVRLYDVTGRLVRTLADKTYQGGQEYSAIWDGRNDAGSQVARGVYFARIDYASGAAINGRVVVLQ